LYDADVFITPGGIFGTAGEQFIRISLCSDVKNFEESIRRVKARKALSV
jgi:aspartate/methionine/tyrosine aminotransferase